MNFIFNRNFAKVFGILCVFEEAWTRNMPKIIFSMLLKRSSRKKYFRNNIFNVIKKKHGQETCLNKYFTCYIK